VSVGRFTAALRDDCGPGSVVLDRLVHMQSRRGFPGDGERPLTLGSDALASRRVRNVWLGSYPAHPCAERSVIMGRRESRGRHGRRKVRRRLVAPNGKETAAPGQPFVSRYAPSVVDVKARAAAAGIVEA
jgi:hypothetical protein